MPKTIDQFDSARTPYLDTDLFGMGYGSAPTPTYKGTLLDLFNYLSKKLGTGQLTLIGNTNYIMQPTDSELSTSTALTFSPTWTLVPASSVVAGQRRRIVDLAGAIVQGTYQIAVAPSGSDKINGVTGVVWLASRFGHIIVESDGISNWAIVDFGPNLLNYANLSDLPSPSTARGNLGLGSAAVHNATDFMVAANNLSELLSMPTARSNLGLGSLAVLSSVAYSNLDPSMIATSADVAAGTPNKLVPSNVVLGSTTPVVIPFAQTGGVWDFGTFINGLWNIPATSTATITLGAPAHVKAGQSGFIIIKNLVTGAGRTVQWPQPIFNLVPSTATSTLFPLNSANLFEYWTESTTLVRIRVTTNI